MEGMPVTTARRRPFAIAASVVLIASAAGLLSAVAARAAAAPDLTASQALETYCGNCHNGRMLSPSARLLDAFDASASAETWSRAYRQLQAGTMPPVGAMRPDRATTAVILSSIEQMLAVAAKPRPASDSGELATRLALLLWNSTPDAALIADAERDRLRDPAALEQQVRRMLADVRAEAFVARFFFPWLRLDTLKNADPDKRSFPEYDPSLREALARETELFLLSQLRDDRDPLELWSANYTFLNEQLAKHYGVADVRGPQFRRVEWSTPERLGLLGHGSILMATSRHQHGVDAAYTTPATRARWVREHFLGANLPTAFQGAQPVKPELPITPQTRALPAQPCTTCHRNFFPLGYALENFDPIGRWRTNDQAGPVDASGSFVDGSATNGVVQLREVLLQHPDAFRTTVTEQLLLFASNNPLTLAAETPDTLITARQILEHTPQVRWSTLVAAVVRAATR
jgi:hypothetical protein